MENHSEKDIEWKLRVTKLSLSKENDIEMDIAFNQSETEKITHFVKAVRYGKKTVKFFYLTKKFLPL